MADRIAINTGPLVALARAGALDLIGALPLSFVCPLEVRAELDAGAVAGYLIRSLVQRRRCAPPAVRFASGKDSLTRAGSAPAARSRGVRVHP